MKTIEALHQIQTKLNAPKNQENKFGGYRYRSLEDICGALKPLLSETGAVFTMSDEMIQVGDRIYVKAVATIRAEDEPISAIGWAREPSSRKGMDDAQVTGATSSYARKYAANALFCIDDIKDPDSYGSDDKHDQKKGGKNDKEAESVYSKFLDIVLSMETPESVNKFMTDNAKTIKAQLDGTKYLDQLRADCKKRMAELSSNIMG